MGRTLTGWVKEGGKRGVVVGEGDITRGVEKSATIGGHMLLQNQLMFFEWAYRSLYTAWGTKAFKIQKEGYSRQKNVADWNESLKQSVRPRLEPSLVTDQ